MTEGTKEGTGGEQSGLSLEKLRFEFWVYYWWWW